MRIIIIHCKQYACAWKSYMWIINRANADNNYNSSYSMLFDTKNFLCWISFFGIEWVKLENSCNTPGDNCVIKVNIWVFARLSAFSWFLILEAYSLPGETVWQEVNYKMWDSLWLWSWFPVKDVYRCNLVKIQIIPLLQLVNDCGIVNIILCSL